MSQINLEVKQTCDALGRYYSSLGKEYAGLLCAYVEENGLDEIDEELEQPPEECLLVDFDDNFPFETEPDNQKMRQEFIYNMIRKCRYNPQIMFEESMPQFTQKLFEIEENDVEEIKKLYKAQCPVLWNSGMDTDIGFLQILAVARKYSFDYLQHLVDDYDRNRIENIDTRVSVADWSRHHKHFKKLDTLTCKVQKQEGKIKVKCSQLARGAVESFGKRCTPKMLFSNMMSIDDSIEVTVQFIYASINFISNLLKSPNTICPFQIDFCIAVGKPFVSENNVSHVVTQMTGLGDDDDDDDDDDVVEEEVPSAVTEDEKKADFFVDCVGDIQAKLQKNGLKFKVKQQDLAQEARIFDDMYTEFVKENELGGSDEKTDYLQKKRLVTFVDRRDKNEEKCNMFMFEPPKNCQLIPKDAVAEWYISSSRTCLLPNLDYGDGSDAVAGDKTEKKEDNAKVKQKIDNKTKMERSNIGASFHAKCGLVTFSFHVKQANVIKCYLYWNGQMIRFMPQDIRTVLPRIFNMDYGGNKAYIEKHKELDGLIKEMQTKLVDKKFEAFQQSYL